MDLNNSQGTAVDWLGLSSYYGSNRMGERKFQSQQSEQQRPNKVMHEPNNSLANTAPSSYHIENRTFDSQLFDIPANHIPHLLSHDCLVNSAFKNDDCSDGTSTDGSSQLLLMDIRTDELNFSEIKEVWLIKSWQEIMLRVSFVAPIVLLGLIGNLTIIYSICRFKPIRSKPTNIFILNMALADLITSLVCPNAALLTDIHQFYVLGPFICRFEGFIKITCLLVSAYSLIVLSFEWLLSVVQPCRTRITIKQSWLTLITIWIVSIAMAMPLLYLRRLRERQWKDLVEVWCCELIQYTKYYWVGMTLFLIYLPTFIMTIVLVVILAQMDRFEAKLKRSKKNAAAQFSNHHQTSLSNISSVTTSESSQSQTPVSLGSSNLNNSLSISMKYRRRILKILFFYLLTSIVCWTPLQFVIVYRHFRTEAVPASWFFELTFYSQLCASLSAAMNPIIFGFLSQPFRRVVTKSWMFRLLDKVWIRNVSRRGNDRDVNQIALGNRNQANNHDLIARNNLNYLAKSSQRVTRDLDQPKLTLDYIEHDLSDRRGSRITVNQPHRSRSNSHHRHHCSKTNNSRIHKTNSGSRPPSEDVANGGEQHDGDTRQVAYNRIKSTVKIQTNGSANSSTGRDNEAYVMDELEVDGGPV